jgi:hypothetical protein
LARISTSLHNAAPNYEKNVVVTREKLTANKEIRIKKAFDFLLIKLRDNAFDLRRNLINALYLPQIRKVRTGT